MREYKKQTMKLTTENLAQLSNQIIKPSYNRTAVNNGIVHIGVGGFHRAHQAYYTEELLNQGKSSDWGICGVGVRSADRGMLNALGSQDHLYTLFELTDAEDFRVQVISSIGDFILLEDEPERLMTTLTAPETRIVSLTITEGGYCTDDSTGKFLADLPQIQQDLANPQSPQTVFGLIVEALHRRRTANIPPFTVMSCDNLPHNGRVARNAVLSFAELRDADLKEWIAAEVTFPNGMVDRITPMTSDEHKQQLLADHGIDDEWPVVCEPFIQWVLEDKFCNGRPEWEAVGVQFTQDVTPYEEMKIGLLNGSHLALTYVGFLMGYRFVHQTMEDPLLQKYVRTFMDLDVTPLLAEAPGIDFDNYKDTLIERFSNPVICDQLSRVCSDGSSKFAKFVFPTLLKLIEQDKPLDRTALIVAAWAHYLRGVDEKGETYAIPDPRAEELQRIVTQSSHLEKDFLGLYDVFGAVIPASEAFVNSFNRQLAIIQEEGVAKALEKVLA